MVFEDFMKQFDESLLKNLYKPDRGSHKGQNGKLLIIGGSKLFHSASIWAAEVASRIVDMVFYSSIDENNEIVKGKFQNGIVVPRKKLDHYIEDADCILIGPGLPREEGVEEGDDDTKILTESLIKKHPSKRWVIDGGSLQVIGPDTLPPNSIITPHHKEFEILFGTSGTEDTAFEMAKKYGITILLKGPKDIVCNINECFEIVGGNVGMTKGGTGDVLAGLVASFYCKNDALLSAASAAVINKKAAESLEKKMGTFFNATDLANEIPIVLNTLTKNYD